MVAEPRMDVLRHDRRGVVRAAEDASLGSGFERLHVVSFVGHKVRGARRRPVRRAATNRISTRSTSTAAYVHAIWTAEPV